MKRKTASEILRDRYKPSAFRLWKARITAWFERVFR
jgi:hypothetical protein